eukprot:gnl/Hemi2/17685_TR5828_c0_g1_i1.p1 gnl/Hemi2/17685_TR5828_c0_g1~~gnl/Hemi2/17685_TR5828_c0_g1_i1.p1  ORF type:complete len:545 (+),score=164.07 gnl/Hemi2/17685_TR5828_c0_g1_i1:79-1713(+)
MVSGQQLAVLAGLCLLVSVSLFPSTSAAFTSVKEMIAAANSHKAKVGGEKPPPLSGQGTKLAIPLKPSPHGHRRDPDIHVAPEVYESNAADDGWAAFNKGKKIGKVLQKAHRLPIYCAHDIPHLSTDGFQCVEGDLVKDLWAPLWLKRSTSDVCCNNRCVDLNRVPSPNPDCRAKTLEEAVEVMLGASMVLDDEDLQRLQDRDAPDISEAEVEQNFAQKLTVVEELPVSAEDSVLQSVGLHKPKVVGRVENPFRNKMKITYEQVGNTIEIRKGVFVFPPDMVRFKDNKDEFERPNLQKSIIRKYMMNFVHIVSSTHDRVLVCPHGFTGNELGFLRPHDEALGLLHTITATTRMDEATAALNPANKPAFLAGAKLFKTALVEQLPDMFEGLLAAVKITSPLYVDLLKGRDLRDKPEQLTEHVVRCLMYYLTTNKVPVTVDGKLLQAVANLLILKIAKQGQPPLLDLPALRAQKVAQILQDGAMQGIVIANPTTLTAAHYHEDKDGLPSSESAAWKSCGIVIKTGSFVEEGCALEDWDFAVMNEND